MGSAKVKIPESILLELFGLEYFQGTIRKVEMENKNIVFYIDGEDERLPKKKDYPDSYIIAHAVKSHIQEI